MKKNTLTSFDLDAAFKALDEIEYVEADKYVPAVEKRVLDEDLSTGAGFKSIFENYLKEDYFNVEDDNELDDAAKAREAEIKAAKLDRIEKIVDLDAKTVDDIKQSYVGKIVIQCPQCMQLFYKNREDLEKDEDNPNICNINEPCPNCGYLGGYNIQGKIDEEVAEEAPVEDDLTDENELDLNFDDEETDETEETPEAEENEEESEDLGEEPEEDLDLDLDLDLEDEEKNESFKSASKTHLTESAEDPEEITDDVSDEEFNELINDSTFNESLTESANIDGILSSFSAQLDSIINKAMSVNMAPVDEALEDDLNEAVAITIAVDEIDDEVVETEPTDAVIVANEPAGVDVMTDNSCPECGEEVIPAAEMEAPEITEPVEVDEEPAAEEVTEDDVEEIEIDEEDEEVTEDLDFDHAFDDELTEDLEEDSEETDEINMDLEDTEDVEAEDEANDESDEETEEVEEEISEEDDLKSIVQTFVTALLDKGIIETSDEEFEEALTEECHTALTEAELESTDEANDDSEETESDDAEKKNDAEENNNEESEDKKEDEKQPEEKKGLMSKLADKIINKLVNSQKVKDLIAKFTGVDVNEVADLLGELDPSELVNIFKGSADVSSKVKDVAKKIVDTNDDVVGTSELNNDSSDGKEGEIKVSVVKKIADELGSDLKKVASAFKTSGVALLAEELNCEEIDDESIEECASKSLTDVYENVEDFKLDEIELDEDELKVEGYINFKSGNRNKTTYVFNECIVENDTIKLVGTNKTFSKDSKFILEGKLNKKNHLIVESISYKYNTQGKLVEGLAKRN